MFGPGSAGGPMPGGMPPMGESLPDDVMQQFGGNKTTGASQSSQMQKMMQQAQQKSTTVSPVDVIKGTPNAVVDQLGPFLTANQWLGIDQSKLNQDQKKRLTQTHQGFQRLDNEIQQEGKKRFQAEMQARQKKKEEEQRAHYEKQKNAARSEAVLPSSPKKGPVGPSGSKKQKATQQLISDRKTLGGGSGKN